MLHMMVLLFNLHVLCLYHPFLIGLLWFMFMFIYLFMLYIIMDINILLNIILTIFDIIHIYLIM